MGKRGRKPQRKVKMRWSPEFAYAIGLLTTDGNLSSDKRHISLVSNDKEQILTFKKCLHLTNKIARHTSGATAKKAFRIQFGDVVFYKFLLGIGLTPNKSKTLGTLKIPSRYFFDFLRGHFDGDGTFYAYWDPRWRSSFMFYSEFLSASRKHIDWIRKELFEFLKIRGHITKSRFDSTFQLKYAKAESLILLPKMYYNTNVACLERKRKKIEQALATKRSGI